MKVIKIFEKLAKVLASARMVKREEIREYKLGNADKTDNIENSYSRWIEEVESERGKKERNDKNTRRSTNPKSKNTGIISIVLIVTEKERHTNKLINNSIKSLQKQSQMNWELIITGQFSDIKTEDQRIKFEKNTSVDYSEIANLTVNKCKGDYVIFIRAGDQLAINAIRVLHAIDSFKIIYTDEDYLKSDSDSDSDSTSNRQDPTFKPDWNPDYLSEYNYFSKAVVFDIAFFEQLGGFNVKAIDPWHDLLLRGTSQLSANDIRHVDDVLFHFINKEISKPINNSVTLGVDRPLVSIIIPTKDHVDLLKVCIESLLAMTNYTEFEILIVDNQSIETETLDYLNKLSMSPNIRIIKYDMVFNYSDMNNLAVKESKGSLVCFLNNDISIIEGNWLSEMVSQVLRPDIGCVGAKLLYPDGSIQHAGVILGLKGYASHAHKGFSRDDAGYANRLIVRHNVSAVTAACLLVRKSVFEEVHGFDAINLKVAYNDVDFCLKVREAGYRNLFTPYAKLIHHESKSRGKKRNKTQQKQLRAESRYLLKKWGGVLFNDPAYNKNLTLLKEDFSLGFDRHVD